MPGAINLSRVRAHCVDALIEGQGGAGIRVTSEGGVPAVGHFEDIVINDTEARAIHLAFAIFLAYTAYPTFKKSPRNYIPVQDWAMALIGAFCAAYIFIFYVQLSDRPGDPTTVDLIVSVVGLIMLLEATRRALGPPLMVVACVFIIYTFGGAHMPDVIAHKGASLSKGMSHYWLSTEGVFGVALGVSTGMVFMFVLFGSLLESAGETTSTPPV